MWTSKNRGRYDRSALRYPSDLTDDRREQARDGSGGSTHHGTRNRQRYRRRQGRSIEGMTMTSNEPNAA
jgi:hypothetical protein